uniref:Putative secreted protein n=1 Tax=Ixodes ricinus TaxID=34613 RepID=A0A6B0UE52_IXORI
MPFVVSLIVLPTISDKRAHALFVGMLFSAGRSSPLVSLPPRLALSRLVIRDPLGSAVKCIVFDFPRDFLRRLQVANFAICDVVHVPFWLLRHFTFGL